MRKPFLINPLCFNNSKERERERERERDKKKDRKVWKKK